MVGCQDQSPRIPWALTRRYLGAWTLPPAPSSARPRAWKYWENISWDSSRDRIRRAALLANTLSVRS